MTGGIDGERFELRKDVLVATSADRRDRHRPNVFILIFLKSDAK